MSLGRQYVPYALKYEYLFSRQMKNNRVELIQDFPKDNDAEVISSLQVCLNSNFSTGKFINFFFLLRFTQKVGVPLVET